ncbi:hypothetical protein [Cellulomonas sp. PhB143]|uniref:hypothetical protein n=1 Tax=Cellulomonas sp. PhB143 TaxID=2485186 RepID=UPI000F488EE3|nr:hypothetical protein [Cellulomonas sp. PhB143]ROS72070.1 hypothetical protein EDF32_2814 [Cellulomonas sp. PhB143]
MTRPTTTGAPAPGTRAPRPWPVLAALAWAAAVPLLWWWGGRLARDGEIMLSGDAAPFTGRLQVDVGPGTFVAAGVAALVVTFGPRLAARLAWRPLLLVAWATALVWTVALGASARWGDLTHPLEHRQDYLAAVPGAAADPGGFLATLQSDPVAYPVHVRGHPPAFTLLLAGMDRLGLGGAGWEAALVILAGTSTVVAVATTLRALGGRADTAGAAGRADTAGAAGAGERTARLALPAVVLAPAALWVATSADAFYAGVLAWGVALLALASTTTSPAARWSLAVAAGLVLGEAPFLSWGLAHMAVVVLAVPLVSRRWRPTLLAGAVVLASVVAWGVAGYWVWDGLAATHEAFTRGIADARPYGYFLVADAVLLGVLVGPAGVGGLTRVRRLDPATRWLAGLALATAALGALGGFEKGEVERIWLPVACWVAPAAAALAVRAPGREPGRVGWSGALRWWLVAQAAVALLVETRVHTSW